MMEEIWKDIEGYPEYEVSNLGRVRGKPRYNKHSEGHLRFIKGREMKIHVNAHRRNYCYVNLTQNNKSRYILLHRLVASAFIPNPENKPEANHKNGDKLDNRAVNLEWVTGLENKRHAWRTGLCNADHVSKKVKCVETGEIFKSVAEASRKMRIDLRFLFRHLAGDISRVKGFTFERINNEHYGKNRPDFPPR